MLLPSLVTAHRCISGKTSSCCVSKLRLLSATVLSLIPMILPFQWQSLMLPVLPGRMAEFLYAPVPFIVGLLNKPNDFKMKTSNLVQKAIKYSKMFVLLVL